jgi:KUP system potassium uptake protein
MQIDSLPDEFYRMTAHFGFMEFPTIGEIIAGAALSGFIIDLEKTTFFIGRETLVGTHGQGLPRWREALFIVMSRNAENAAEFFRLPSNRTIEIGRQVEI